MVGCVVQIKCLDKNEYYSKRDVFINMDAPNATKMAYYVIKNADNVYISNPRKVHYEQFL